MSETPNVPGRSGADASSGKAQAARFSGKTAWARNLQTPLREFLRTETGGAAVLLAGAVAALVWVNVDASSYDSLWHTKLAIRIGDAGVTLDLRGWVNSGLMTFFFFVVGLEARREWDLGELRERRRTALPLLAGLGGMAVAIAIYLAFNSGRSSAHGWGIAMSTDTAFALGLLALLGRRFPERLRAFMLTLLVVDDVASLLVIATVYTENLKVAPLLVAVAFYLVVIVARSIPVRIGFVYFVLGAGAWVGLLRSGVEPVVIGLAMGILTFAIPAERSSLERATERFREFREQPTAELARSVGAQLRSATSTNERLQQLWHPWTSYAIVPVFALANTGIAVNGALLSRAFTSPITLGILVGYVVGKPVGITGGSWLVMRLSGGRLRPPVGWAAVGGAGTIAGAGFTVALLVATLAFDGRRLEEAKVGILSAVLGASLLTWLLFRATRRLPRRLRTLAVFRTGRSGAAPRLRRRPLRLAAPAVERRPPERPARRRGVRSGGQASRLLGDARSVVRPPGRARAKRPDGVRGATGPRHRAIHERRPRARGRGADRRGRRQRRPQRGFSKAVVTAGARATITAS